MAEVLSQPGDPNGAIEEYHAALTLNPSLAKACRGLGAVYLDKHEWQKTQQALQVGVERNPQDTQAWYWLGRAFMARHHFSWARAAFETATLLGPKDVAPYSNLGLALMAQGHSKETEKALKKAIALQPDFAEAHHRLERDRAARKDSGQLIHSAHHILHTLFGRE